MDPSRNSNPSSYDPASAKGPKRKRLAKACDACHKSKRRCDGTALCSNCYHASKPCTYTDANGRSVPAPRQDPADFPPDDRMRKKIRPETILSHTSVVAASSDLEHPPRSKLEPSMTREMTNLFFAHCHLAVAVIHRPTFTSSLAHPGLVPPFLLLAIYALAAPFSKQLSLRTSSFRPAGKRFAGEAAALMYNSDGSPALQPSLQVAQATCLLLIHENIQALNHSAKSTPDYRESTLKLLQTLNVYTPEHSPLTPLASKSHVNDSIHKECIRRMFWIVYFLDCFRGVYGPFPHSLSHNAPVPTSQSAEKSDNSSANTSNILIHSGSTLRVSKDSPTQGRDDASDLGGAPTGFTETELRLRLPADETSFELAVVHSTLPEYLYLPAVRTQYASELGHLIRVITIYQRVESAIDRLLLASSSPNTTNVQTVAECSRLLEEWLASLPAHLQFNEENLNIQLSMLMTPSSTGSWCYAGLHVIYASCSLALEASKAILEENNGSRLSPASSQIPANSPEERRSMSWAMEILEEIMNSWATKTKCCFLLGSILWSLIRYCDRASDPQVLSWASDYEEVFGANIIKLLEHRIIPRGFLNLRALPLSHSNESSNSVGSLMRPDRSPDILKFTPSSLSSDSDSFTPHSNPLFHSPPSHSITSTNATLPSLKASGLLDWNSNTSATAGPRLPSIDFLADNWQ